MALTKQERSDLLPDLLGRTWFDRFLPGRLFPEWLAGEVAGLPTIRVEEYVEDGKLVVHAELPGVDPDKDVEVTVHDGLLDIQAERREEEKGKGHSEFRYGTFRRVLTLPVGVAEKDITATYRDGILEVRVPVGKAEAPAKRVRVSRAA